MTDRHSATRVSPIERFSNATGLDTRMLAMVLA